jgi:hypothetical protein
LAGIISQIQGNIYEHDGKVAGAREDEVTGMIESRTSQIPSAAYLGAALGSMAFAAILRMAGKKHASLFVGQWAAPLLLMGVYNKMVSLETCRKRALRPTPIALRTAYSCWRCSPHTNNKAAALPQPIKSTSAAAPVRLL